MANWQPSGYVWFDGERWVHEYFDCTYALIRPESDLADSQLPAKILPEEESMIKAKTEEDVAILNEVERILLWFESQGGTRTYTPVMSHMKLELRYKGVEYIAHIRDDNTPQDYLGWVKRRMDEFMVMGLPSVPAAREGGCPKCGGELKTATLFMTVEERCECGFWRPAEPAAA